MLTTEAELSNSNEITCDILLEMIFTNKKHLKNVSYKNQE